MTEKSNDEIVKEQGIAIVDSLVSRTSKETVALIKQVIESGESDPAYVGIVLKKFAKVQKLVSEDKALQEVIDNETKKHQQGSIKTFTVYGSKIILANMGYTDFSQTEDLYLERLLEIEAQTKELIKARKEQIVNQAAVWESKNSPLNIQKFGIKPFVVSWEDLPELTFVEGYGECNTNPPIKKGKEVLKYYV